MLLSPLVPPSVPALIFAFSGLRVGIAESSAGPPGITFSHCSERAYAAVDVRGGPAGTTFTDALRGAHGKFVSGIAYGGSAYGLEAGCAVAAGLFSSGLASNKRCEIAIVPAVVVFDYKGRDNHVHPDRGETVC